MTGFFDGMGLGYHFSNWGIIPDRVVKDLCLAAATSLYPFTCAQEVDSVTIFVVAIDPLLGALGSAGAIAINGP